MDSGLPAQQQIKQSKSGVHMMASLNVQSQAISRWVLVRINFPVDINFLYTMQYINTCTWVESTRELLATGIT